MTKNTPEEMMVAVLLVSVTEVKWTTDGDLFNGSPKTEMLVMTHYTIPFPYSVNRTCVKLQICCGNLQRCEDIKNSAISIRWSYNAHFDTDS